MAKKKKADLVEENKPMFLVMKLLKSVETTDFTGNKYKTGIGGLDAFVPVYDTIERAEEAAEGKFQIVAIRVIE